MSLQSELLYVVLSDKSKKAMDFVKRIIDVFLAQKSSNTLSSLKGDSKTQNFTYTFSFNSLLMGDYIVTGMKY